MLTEPLTGFLELDWPEEYTSHRFVEGKPPPEQDYITNGKMTWHRCELCGSFKLVRTRPANNTGPEERIIWKTVPYNLTSVCPNQTQDHE